MKTMKWLVQREFWEHKGSMLWAPIAVAAAIVLFIGGTVTYAIGMGRMRGVINVNGHEAEMSEMVNALTTRHQQTLVDVMASGYLSASGPLYIMMAFTIFFYCMGSMYEERRDRSILFWKSLPVSDQQTVLSKLITAICVIPLIIVGVAILASLVILLMACAALAVNGVNLFDDILTTPSVYMAPLQLIGVLPVYALWALPTIGWLMMVSAWAKSKVFLWAVGTPVIAIVIVKWAETLFGADLNADWFIQNVVARGLLGLVPGSWFGFENIEPAFIVEGSRRAIDLSGVLAQSWMTLAAPAVWIGALAGAAMIFAAMRLRRWKDEG